MTDFLFFLSEINVVNFVLLFVRISAMMVFVPFFSSQTIFPTVKAAIALFVTIILFPLLPPPDFALSSQSVLLAVISEAAFGFAVGVAIQLVFVGFQFAADQIAFAMSFSMATAMDPQSEATSTVITQFFYLFAILLFLAFDGHHLILAFAARSLESVPLGGFLIAENFLLYTIKAFGWSFVLGITVAFPVVALSLLSDIAFGMIMKTVPSFNLLVVGMPARIFLALLVLTVTMGTTAFIFKRELYKAINALGALFI
ncbi:MAG: flagellar type III secretion system protein FliR [Helicobacteraceae bacterium]|jgi:flagellar biosynthetic protein FliR|nr:flagellar type III secretion system protein FliR [Helicobacteraceae bacterium]